MYAGTEEEGRPGFCLTCERRRGEKRVGERKGRGARWLIDVEEQEMEKEALSSRLEGGGEQGRKERME